MRKILAFFATSLFVCSVVQAKVVMKKSKDANDKVWALVKKKKGDNKKLYLMTLSERILVNKAKFYELNSVKKDAHKHYQQYRVPASARLETEVY